jgi:hypothetical protein
MSGFNTVNTVLYTDQNMVKAILEFDFVPDGSTVNFNYIFGSEKYPEFCIGGSFDLTANPSGGTSLYTYAWDNGEEFEGHTFFHLAR